LLVKKWSRISRSSRINAFLGQNLHKEAARTRLPQRRSISSFVPKNIQKEDQILTCCHITLLISIYYNRNPLFNSFRADNAMTPSLYQVSFLEENIARVSKNSKTRVTWTFRVAASPADAAQGREHSISLTWSKKTGKQEIFMDGTEEVWFGRHRGASVFDHSWETETEGLPIQLRILATCAPKLHQDFRCYDLIINGQLFAYLPHYGVNGPTPSIMAESPFVAGRPGSIFEIIYPNENINGWSSGEEQRQPEHEPSQQMHHFTPMVEDDVDISEPRSETQPVDLLGNISEPQFASQPVDLLSQ
jgi:hypothetical protein